MILKGSQRGGAKQLAVHLLRRDQNEHVELHDVRGFIADDLTGALQEAYAVSKATRCKQFLFSLSLSPPEKESVSVETFEKAVDAIEAKLGLTGQPRVIVFHEKQGRRHAHCVWSRIDGEAMRAINLPHFKLKLRDISRELYLEHGWLMPQGFVDSAESDPRNFTRAEWQQAKRAEQDPIALKTLFQDCWAISDSRKAFAQALAARGFYLAQGDRRSFVVVDVRGEVYAIARWVGIRTKQVQARLGDPKDLPTVAETKGHIAELLKGMLGRHLDEVDSAFAAKSRPLAEKRTRLVERHREERTLLDETQATRAVAEARQRAQRFRTGLRGLWDRLTGRHSKIKTQNEAEARASIKRNALERQTLIDTQLGERRMLQHELVQLRNAHTREKTEIHSEFADVHAEERERIKPGRNPDVEQPAPLRRRKLAPSP